jgi:hypothetical protein
MSKKTLRQRIEEDTGIDLSPMAIARDRRLRALYETYIEAKNESEKEAAYKAFAQFVSEQYP